MYISGLSLTNFRNYKSLNLSLSPRLNILIGKNAQGKTNLLESIYICGIGKSFKVVKDKDLINWNQNSASISIKIDREIRKQKIDINFYKDLKKVIKIDGISIRKTGELLGELPVVFFSPDELKLIKESPEERRRFMNIDISQTNKRYFYLLSRYDKILQNRNKLLKNTTDIKTIVDLIDIWNRALAECAEKIVIERQKFIDEILPYAKKAHEYISNGTENLEIEYKTEKIKGNYKEGFIKLLEKNLEKDFKLGYTTIGPHRDDLDIYLNGVEVKNFGSQGQQRTAALSLKLAELEIIKNRIGDYPILLLDDVFSELDSFRRERLIKFTSRTQTIITCTDFAEKPTYARIFKINSGKVDN